MNDQNLLVQMIIANIEQFMDTERSESFREILTLVTLLFLHGIQLYKVLRVFNSLSQSVAGFVFAKLKKFKSHYDLFDCLFWHIY